VLNTNDARPAVSIVAPCFNEEQCLLEFHRRASATCRALVGESYQIVLVDDGSRDTSWELIEKLSLTDRRVVGVRLMRNYGHQLAATAGLSVAKGRRLMLIDADLQDPPELLSDMMRLMEQGADVVYGKRITRSGESWFKAATAAGFYRVLSFLSEISIPRDTGDFRLMSRRFVDILLAMPEHHRFIRGMVSWIGGRQVPLEYKRDPRYAGRTKYSFSKMLRFAADAVTGFSIVPLRLASLLGVAVGALGLVTIVYALIQWMRGHVVPGWSSTLIVITIFSSTQLMVLGIIGEYLGRLSHEMKRRPMFLIDRMIADGGEQAVELARSGSALNV
jgi:polyisoprenyl-phosphate glycosyltransferase